MWSFLRIFRIILGLVLIGIGLRTNVYWWYLGIIPLFMGIANLCPLCTITGKCGVKKN